MAREYFGLSVLERCTQDGGSLSVHIGDALSPSVAVQGGFAGNLLILAEVFVFFRLNGYFLYLLVRDDYYSDGNPK